MMSEFSLIMLWSNVHTPLGFYSGGLILKPKEEELFPGSLSNIVNRLVQELQGINPTVTNALHIRGSVIINGIKHHNKRQVQYMAGHRYISSTKVYQLQVIDSLLDELSKHHPFG